MKYALIVVDVQTGIVIDLLYNKTQVISIIKDLISFCREHQVEVIYVRHDDGPESDFTKGMDDWQIYQEVAPIGNEKVFDKTVNSIFKECGLKEYLQGEQIQDVIIVGLQTEYCIDASIKAGFEHGFSVIVPDGATSTLDNHEFTGKQLSDFFSYVIWNKRYARVLPVSEVKQLLLGSN